MINPIHKLYLYSFEDKKVWNVNNIICCILDEAYKKNKLKFKDNKYSIINIEDEELIETYLSKFLYLLKNKAFFEMKEYIDNINFKNYLENQGYLIYHTKSGFFKKEIIEKTEKYYNIINELKEDPIILNKLVDKDNLNNYFYIADKIREKIRKLINP